MQNQSMKTFNIIELVNKTNDGTLLSDITLQREIVYDNKKQEFVIDSLMNDYGIPPIILWEIADGIYEVIDGKQRINSIKNFINGSLYYNGLSYYDLGIQNKELQNKFKNLVITAQILRGDEHHKRTTFYRINTSAVPLSKFEVINSLVNNNYINELNQFVSSNKDLNKIFNEPNARGKYQFEILKWIVKTSDPIKIANYMNDQKSFESDKKLIMRWIRFILNIFVPIKSKYVDLGLLVELAQQYNDYYNQILVNAVIIKQKIKSFYDDKIQLKLIDAKVKKQYFSELLNLQNLKELDERRWFSLNDKEILIKNQNLNKENIGICNHCKNEFETQNLEVDHITPWSLGGKTTLDNAQILCRSCNAKKSNK